VAVQNLHLVFMLTVITNRSLYDDFSGYQLGQMVEWWENQHFEDHLCPRPQVFETLVFSLLNHLTWLIAQENFIIRSRQESNESHN